MAKKQSNQDGINKSQLVRELLTKNPKMPVKEVVAALAERNLKITPNLVYFLRSRMSHKAKREKRQRAVQASRDAGIANPVQLILEVRRVAEKAGGMRRLKELVDVLAQ